MTKPNLIMAAVSLAASAIAGASIAYAASFECSEDSSCTEHVICQSPQLSNLDSRMSELYHDLMARLSESAADRLGDSQRAWLKSRNSCSCNANCLIEHYSSRVRMLERMSE